jgi:NAD-dependent deacetylase
MRPDVVLFGEAVPGRVFDRAVDAARSAEVCVVVGTSALVYPAASLPEVARGAGAFLVEVNPEETPLTALADASLRGPAGEILPRLDV